MTDYTAVVRGALGEGNKTLQCFHPTEAQAVGWAKQILPAQPKGARVEIWKNAPVMVREITQEDLGG
jgi:hypothetical protein